MFGATKALKEQLATTTSELHAQQALWQSLQHSMIVAEWSTDGTLVSANSNFSQLMGYAETELRGMAHSRLCAPQYAQGCAYQQVWQQLRLGQACSARIQHLTKSGTNLWLDTSFAPVKDGNGAVSRIVQIASDVTASVEAAAQTESLVEAINRSMAVIEFDMNGNILNANDNFLKVVGYSLAELKGCHHSKLCSAEYTQSNDYREFWSRLNHGDFFSGQFQRVGNGGRTVWLEATYNPVIGKDGKPYRVIKFASDVTAQMQRFQAEQHTAQTAYQISMETENLSASGQEVILQAISKMRFLEEHVTTSSNQVQSLGDKTNQITSIVNTIREIADQTNLLALNAAIEAARAGETGRGFAVVADEVRKLAERTANSTSEISQMIGTIQAESQAVIHSMEQSLAEVEEGVQLANNADAAIHKIREGAHKVVDVVQELSKTIKQ